MNQEDSTKALELITQSASFGMLLPEKPDFDTLAAAEALAHMLTANQKVVGLLSPAPLPHDTDKTTFPLLTGPTPLLKEFIISVDTSRNPVTQLRYEKPENRIDIILTPKSDPIGQGAVSFREGTIRCDCLITIGVPDVEHLANSAAFPPEFFTENKLINIDIGNGNMRYGEANYVDSSRASRSELVYQLLTRLSAAPVGAQASTASSPTTSPLPSAIATLLLAGILSATQELASMRTSADAFTAVAELLRLDASHSDAQKLVHTQTKSQPLNLLQLFARASVRSKHDETEQIMWSFLTIEDFAKTNRSSGDVPATLAYIRATFPKSLVTVLLWQDASHFENPDEKDTRSGALVRIALSGDQAILDAVAHTQEYERMDQGLPGQGIMLRKPFSSFREAEEYVHSLIRTAL